MRIKIKIQGKTPLLCNRFTDEAQMKSASGTRIASVGHQKSPREEAEPKLYIGTKGVPIIPQPNLFRCIIDAGKFFKNGKSKVTTLKSSLIPACVELEGIEFEIKHKEPWEVDSRPIVNPVTGGRIPCHRPKFNDWALEFTLILDTELMGADLLRDIIDSAGKRIGLGDFRPDRKGPFGRFVVVYWKVI